MRQVNNSCDWCGEGAVGKSLHSVQAKQACAGTSDREAFRLDMCEKCGAALSQRDAVTLLNRRPREDLGS